MEKVIDAIRAAVVPDATPETRAAGVTACRAVLAALEGTPGQPHALPVPTNTIASVIGALRGVPLEQLLDVAIARVRAALPADVNVEPVKAMKLPLVPLPAATRQP